MFKIREVAQSGQASVKTLGYGDQTGLLQPAHLDPFTDNCYYTAAQLLRLHRILAFKELGTPIEWYYAYLAKWYFSGEPYLYIFPNVYYQSELKSAARAWLVEFHYRLFSV